MSWLDFIVLTLATWWVSYTLASQDGPYRLVAKVREAMPLGGLTKCIYCLSIWVGLLWFLVWQTPAQWLAYPFAMAGAALMLNRYVGFNHV